MEPRQLAKLILWLFGDYPKEEMKNERNTDSNLG